MLKLLTTKVSINESLSSEDLQNLFSLLTEKGLDLARLSWKDLPKYLNQYISEEDLDIEDLELDDINIDDLIEWFSGRRLRRSSDQILSYLSEKISEYPDSILSKLNPKVILRILKIYAEDQGYSYNDLFNNMEDKLDVEDFVDWFDLSGSTGNFIFDFCKANKDKLKIKVTDFIDLAKLDDKLKDIINYYALKHNIITKEFREVTSDPTYRGGRISFDTICKWVLSDMNSMPKSNYKKEEDEYKQAQEDAVFDFVIDILKKDDPEFENESETKQRKRVKDYIKANRSVIDNYKTSKDYEDAVDKNYKRNLQYPRSPKSDKDYIDIDLYNDTLEELEKLYKNPPTDLHTIFNEGLTENVDGEVEIEVEDDISVEPVSSVPEKIYTEDVIKSGTKDLLNQLMMDAWSFISKVNSGIITLKGEENVPQKDHILEILNSVADDSTIIVGMLSKVSTLLDENTLALMQKGEKKADNIIKA